MCLPSAKSTLSAPPGFFECGASHIFQGYNVTMSTTSRREQQLFSPFQLQPLQQLLRTCSSGVKYQFKSLLCAVTTSPQLSISQLNNQLTEKAHKEGRAPDCDQNESVQVKIYMVA